MRRPSGNTKRFVDAGGYRNNIPSCSGSPFPFSLFPFAYIRPMFQLCSQFIESLFIDFVLS